MGSRFLVPNAVQGGMTLLSTTTISTQATVSLTSIPQTYVNLFIVIRNFRPATDSSGIGVRINSDSTASRHIATNTNNLASAFSATYWDAGPNNQDNTVANGLTTILLPDYTNTATWKIGHMFTAETDATTTANVNLANYFGAYNQTGAITSVDIISRDGGNITSGTVLLYGVR
jgi:hypothetical protein